MITNEEAGPLVEALGVLLAAYAFFYQVTKAADEQTERSMKWDPKHISPKSAQNVWRGVRSSLPATIGHVIGSAVVALIFLPPTLQVLGGVDPTKRYSALKGALAVLEVVFLVIAWFYWRRFGRLLPWSWRMSREARRPIDPQIVWFTCPQDRHRQYPVPEDAAWSPIPGNNWVATVTCPDCQSVLPVQTSTDPSAVAQEL